MSFYGTAMILTWVVLVVLTLGMIGLARRMVGLEASLAAILRTESDPIPLLKSVPAIEGLSWGDSAQTVLLFASEQCDACRSVIEGLADVLDDETNIEMRRFAIVVAQSWALPDDLSIPDRAVVIINRNAFLDLGVRATPFVAVVGSDGRLLSAGVARSPEGIRSAIDRAARQAAPSGSQMNGGNADAVH